MAPPETPKENPAAVPESKREALAALSTKIVAQDPTSAAKLNDVEKKGEVLTGLRELSKMVETGRVTGVTKTEVDRMHDDIEGAMLVSTRPVEELAQKGLDAFSKLDPVVKQAAIGTAAVGGTALGLFGIVKLLKGAGKAIVKGWDTTLDLAEAGAKKAGSIVMTIIKLAATAGVGALALFGFQRLVQGQAPAESTEQKT